MAIKLYITNKAGTTDISGLVQQITWSGDYLQCARTLEFGLYSDRHAYANAPVVTSELGSKVTLVHNNIVLFDGFIFERQKNTESSIINITCFDRGLYLKNNEATYKFSDLKAEDIAKRVCRDFGIAIGNLASTGVNISRNFIGVSLYKIIQTAYSLASEQTGKHYMIRFTGDKLNVIEKTITNETLIIEGGINLMSASTKESVTNMINQVAIYDDNDILVGVEKNNEAIKLYGVMQRYLKQPKNENVTYKAKKILENNGVNQKITINNLGNVANITGGTVVVKEPYTGLYGLFYIDSDIHTWKLGQYYNKLTVNFKNIMDEQAAGSLPNKSGEKTATADNDIWQYLYMPGGVKNE